MAQRETSLAAVLTNLLRGQDAWEAFTDTYSAAPSSSARAGRTGT